MKRKIATILFFIIDIGIIVFSFLFIAWLRAGTRIVSAGSTASGKIPPNVIVCGNPAVVIKEFKPNEDIFSCYK